MGEIAEGLKARTMRFALDVCELITHLPRAGRDGAPSVVEGRNVSCLQLSCGVPRSVAQGVHRENWPRRRRSRRERWLAGIHRSRPSAKVTGADSPYRRIARAVGDHVGLVRHRALQGAKRRRRQPEASLTSATANPQSITRLPNYPITQSVIGLSPSRWAVTDRSTIPTTIPRTTSRLSGRRVRARADCGRR